MRFRNASVKDVVLHVVVLEAMVFKSFKLEGVQYPRVFTAQGETFHQWPLHLCSFEFLTPLLSVRRACLRISLRLLWRLS